MKSVLNAELVVFRDGLLDFVALRRTPLAGASWLCGGDARGEALECLHGGEHPEHRYAQPSRRVAAAVVLRYARAARFAGRLARVSRLVPLQVCRSTEQAVEAAAVVVIDRLVRAVAARFESEPIGWRCVALCIL